MDLIEIGYRIKSEGLDQAHKKVKGLLDDSKKLGTASEAASNKVAKGNDKVAKSQNSLNEKVKAKTRILKEADKLEKDGLNRSQALEVAKYKEAKVNNILIKNLKTYYQKVNKASEAVKLHNKAIKEAADHTSRHAKSLKKINDMNAKATAHVDAYRKAQEKLQKKINKAHIEAHIENIKREKKAYEQLHNEALEMNKAYDAQKKKMDDLHAQAHIEDINRQKKAYELAHKEALEYNNQLDKENKRVKDLEQQTISLAQKREKEAQVKQQSINSKFEKAIQREIDQLEYLKKGYSRATAAKLAMAKTSGITPAHLARLEQARKATDDYTRSQARLRVSTNGGIDVINNLVFGFKTAIALQFSKTIIDVADKMELLRSRVRLVTPATESVTKAMSDLVDISMETRASLQDTITLYNRLQPALIQFGYTTEQVNMVVSSFNNALLVSGATARETASAILQFSQAMASGKLAGDEFRTVTEAAPELLREAAKAINENEGLMRRLGVTTKITAGDLKTFSKEGKLTPDILSDALIDRFDELFDKAKLIDVNVQQAITQLRTSFTYLIGVVNNSTGATGSLAEQIQKVAFAVKEFADNLKDGKYDEQIEDIKNFVKLVGNLSAGYVALNITLGLYNKSLVTYNTLTTTSIGLTSKLHKALGILGAAFVSWQIGSYMRDQFEFVERAGIALAGGLHETFIRIKGAAQEIGAEIRYSLENPLDAVRERYANLFKTVSFIPKKALESLGLDKAVQFIDTISNGISGDSIGELKKNLSDIRENTELEAGRVSDIYAQMFADVGASSKKMRDEIKGASNEEKVDKVSDFEIETRNLEKLINKTIQYGDVKLAALTVDARKGVSTDSEALKLARERLEVLKDQALVEEYINRQRELSLNPLKELSDFNFESLFGDIGNPFSQAIKGASDLIDKLNDNNDLMEAYKKRGEDITDLEKERFKIQISGTADILGASKQFFDEKSKGYEALEKAEKAFRAVEFAMSAKSVAVTLSDTAAKILGIESLTIANVKAAIAGAAIGVGPAGFATAAAMAALLASFGIRGGSSGGRKSSSNVSSSGIRGTGAVLGDPKEKAESVTNSLETLADISDTQLGYTAQMVQSLRNIESGLVGLTAEFAQLPRKTRFELDKNTSVSNIISGNIQGQIGSRELDKLQNLSARSRAMLGSSNIDRAIQKELDKNAQALEGLTFTSDLQRVVIGMVDTVVEGFDVLGISSTGLRDTIESLQLPQLTIKAGMSAEDLQKKLEDFFSNVGDGIIENVIPSMALFQQGGETLLDTFTRVVGQVSVLKDVNAVFGSSLNSDQLLSVGDSLGKLAGGLSEFSENVDSFFDAFLTEGQEFERISRQVNALFDGLNEQLPSTRSGMFDLVKSFDLTTESGRQAFSVITGATDALEDFYDQLEDITEAAYEFDTAFNLNDGLKPLREALSDVGFELDSVRQVAERTGVEGLGELFKSLTDVQKSALEPFVDSILDLVPAIDEVSQSVETFRNISLGIKQFLAGLNVSENAGSPLQRATTGLTQFRELAALARGGDAEAAQQLTGSASTLINLSRDAFASGGQFQAIYSEIVSTLEDVADITDVQSLDELQYNVMLEQLEALKNLNGGVLGLGDSLTVELTTTAKSNIEKLITFVTETDQFPDDLKAIALNTVGDLDKIVNYIAGNQLPNDLKAIVLNNVDDLTKVTNFAVGSDLSDPVKNILFNNIDDLTKTTNMILGSDLDADSKNIVLNQVNDLIKKTDFVVNSDLSAEQKAIVLNNVDSLNKVVDYVVGSQLPQEMKDIALNNIDTLIKKTDFVTGTLLPDDLKSIVLTNSSELFKTINAGYGDSVDQDALDLAKKTSNSIDVVVQALIDTGSTTEALQLAFSDLNVIETFVQTKMADGFDQEAFDLAFQKFNSVETSINALKAAGYDSEAAALAFKTDETISKTIDVLKGVFSQEAISVLSEADQVIRRVVEANKGQFNPEAITLLNESSELIVRTFEAAKGDFNSDAIGLLSEASETITRTISAAEGTVSDEALNILNIVSDEVNRTINAVKGSFNLDAANLLEEVDADINRIVNAITGQLSQESLDLLNESDKDISRIINALMGDVAPEASNLLNEVSSDIDRIVNALRGNIDADAISLVDQVSSDLDRTINALKGNLNPEAISILDEINSDIRKTVIAAKGTFNNEAIEVLAQKSDSIIKDVVATGGELTPDQQAILNALNGTSNVNLDGDVLLRTDATMNDLLSAIQQGTDVTSYQTSLMFGLMQNHSRLFYIIINELSESRMMWQAAIGADDKLRVMSDYGKALSDDRLVKFAKGGMFTNGIVSSPTPFNMGLMGEAGPEAIMPLGRASNGELGVRLIDGGFNTAPMVQELRTSNNNLQALIRLQQAANQRIIERLDTLDERVETIESKTRLRDSA